MGASGYTSERFKFNQWRSGDKPHMEDFNGDNMLADELFGEVYGKLEEKADKAAVTQSLTGKVSGTFQIFSNVNQLGIENGLEMPEDIMQALPDRAVYYGGVATGNWGIPGLTMGTLHAARIMKHRCFMTLFDHMGSNMWIGVYHELDKPYFKGWKKVLTE